METAIEQVLNQATEEKRRGVGFCNEFNKVTDGVIESDVFNPRIDWAAFLASGYIATGATSHLAAFVQRLGELQVKPLARVHHRRARPAMLQLW